MTLFTPNSHQGTAAVAIACPATSPSSPSSPSAATAPSPSVLRVGSMLDTSKANVTPAALTNALIMYTISSVGMMLGNKMAVTALPLPCLLVIIQVIGTLFLLVCFRSRVGALNYQVAKDWLPIAFLFTFMMYSSMKSFVYVNVATVLIFRNISALLTTFVEYFVRRTAVTAEIILSEVVIVLGAMVYGWSSAAFNWLGLFWIVVNVMAQVSYGVLLKHRMDSHPHIREMNKFTMSFYSNAMALPMVSIMMVAHGELESAPAIVASLTSGGYFVILVTCILGYLISTSGFALQQLVSATTFLVLNNLTKFLNIALGMIFLNDRLSGGLAWGGCFATFAGGFWYSYASMKANAARVADQKRHQQQNHQQQQHSHHLGASATGVASASGGPTAATLGCGASLVVIVPAIVVDGGGGGAGAASITSVAAPSSGSIGIGGGGGAAVVGSKQHGGGAGSLAPAVGCATVVVHCGDSTSNLS